MLVRLLEVMEGFVQLSTDGCLLRELVLWELKDEMAAVLRDLPTFLNSNDYIIF